MQLLSDQTAVHQVFIQILQEGLKVPVERICKEPSQRQPGVKVREDDDDDAMFPALCVCVCLEVVGLVVFGCWSDSWIT